MSDIVKRLREPHYLMAELRRDAADHIEWLRSYNDELWNKNAVLRTENDGLKIDVEAYRAAKFRDNAEIKELRAFNGAWKKTTNEMQDEIARLRDGREVHSLWVRADQLRIELEKSAAKIEELTRQSANQGSG